MKAVTKVIGRRGKIDASELVLSEKVIAIDRITKVVKGGRHLRFRALLVVGDGKGHVGFGLAKAREVPEAIRKAGVVARKGLVEVPIADTTIPHEIFAKFGASKVLLKPAAPGTGVIASNTVRAVLEAAGIKDVLSKSLGSSSPVNTVKATMLALENLTKPGEAAAEGEVNVEVEEAEINEAG
jgi:small subunit ribosomal protein S5